MDDKDAKQGRTTYTLLQSPVTHSQQARHDGNDSDGGDIVASHAQRLDNEAGSDGNKGTRASLVSLRTLFSYADRTDALLMTAGTLGALVAGLGQPIQIVLLGKVFNAFNPMDLPDAQQLRANVNAVALNFVWVGLAMVLGGFVQVACWSLTGARQARRIRSAYVRAILSKDIGWFDMHDPKQLATRVADATVHIQDGMGRKVGDGLHLFSMGIAGIVIGLVKGWELALVLLAFTPLLAITAAVTIRFVASATQRSVASYGAAGSVAQEALENIRTVHMFNAAARFVDQYAAALEISTREGVRKGLALGWGTGVMFFAIYCAYAAGLYYGALQISHDQLRGDGVVAVACVASTGSCYDGGKVMSIFFAVMMGAMALGQAGPSIQAIYAARASAYDVFCAIRTVSRANPLDEDGRILSRVAGEVALRDVTFAYPSRPNVAVCSNYSLTVHAGETVALVGASGSGKSTIVSLLERFYDPQRGVVTLDGVDIRELNVKWLRQQIGLVNQEPVLFATSVLENIRHGDPRASDTRVLDAARRANAFDFVSALPNGFATVVGERGTQLSGGQKQRIALARALVKNPPVLLLDEATSALDAESERLVQQSLDALLATAQRTTIVIAHRLSTIQSASRIAVHSDGHIVELGTHEELLAIRNGHYRRFMHAQTRGTGAHSVAGHADRVVAGGHFLPAAATSAELSEPSYSADHNVTAEANIEVSAKDGAAAQVVLHSARLESGNAHDRGNDESEAAQDARASTMRIWRMSLLEWKFLALGGIGAVVNAAVFPVWGVILTKIVVLLFDYSKTPSELRDTARHWSLSFLVLGAVFGVSIVMQHFGFAVAAQRLVARVRLQTFRAMLQQDIGWFDRDANASGALVAQLATDSAVLQAITAEALNQGLVNATTLGIALVICFYASWQMSLAMLATFPLVLLFSLVLSQQHAGTLSERGGSCDADVAAGALLSEAIASIRTVASLSMEAPTHVAYVALLDAAKRKDMHAGVAGGALFGLSQGGMYMSIAFLFWLGAKWVSDRIIRFEDMFMVQIVLVLSTFAVGLAAQNVSDRSRATRAARRVFRVIDRVPMIDSTLSVNFVPPPVPPAAGSRLRGEIEFHSVAFAYPSRPHAPVYACFSLRVEPGQTVALVGPSGGGKSTAIALLERFYDPSAGRVMIDGRDLREYNLAWLRERISLVSQEPVLFAGTIAENIAIGAAGSASRAQVEDAARKASAHEFIRAFPLGYDTRVGDRGVQLSGGQKQRVAIARAILRDPDVLLLDEATSALDAESERLVQQSLDALLALKKRTTLVVAHRLSTVRGADVIAVTQGGAVVEMGSHDELMAPSSRGMYRALVARQLQQQGEVHEK